MINKISCILFGACLFAALFSCVTDLDSSVEALNRIKAEEDAKLEQLSSSSDDWPLSSSSILPPSSSSAPSSSSEELSSSSENNGGDSSSSEESGESSSSEGEGGDSSSSADAPSSSSAEPSSSSSAPPPEPTFSDCKLPPSYMARSESITNLVTIVNGSGCGQITYTVGSSSSGSASISLNSYSASSTARNLSITAKATCGTVNLEKVCPVTITVASSIVTFANADEPHTDVDVTGLIVFKLPVTSPLQNRLGCDYIGGNDGKPNISFSVTTPTDGKINSETGENWWRNLSKTFSFDYTTNDNRILFETSTPGLKCATTRID